MGRIEQVLDTLGLACQAAINGAGITTPAQGYQGWPTGPELTEILSQNQYAVSFFPMQAGRRITPRTIQHVSTNIVDATLVGTITNTGITFSGACAAKYNVNIIATCKVLGVRIISYVTNSSDTLDTVAIAIANAFNALGTPVSASFSGASVITTGVVGIICNVGAQGTVTQETSRFEQRIKVSVWTPNAYQNTGNPEVDTPKSLRSSVTDAIINNVGTEENMWYDLGDGTSARFRLASLPFYVDDSQSDYNVYESHIVYLAEYSLVSVTDASQVGVVEFDFAFPTGNLNIIGG